MSRFGGGSAPTPMQHKLCGDTTGQSQKTWGWRFLCRKVAQTHSKHGWIAVPSCSTGPHAAQLWNSKGGNDSPSSPCKDLPLLLWWFFHVLSEFPMLQLVAFAPGLCFPWESSSLFNKGPSKQRKEDTGAWETLPFISNVHLKVSCTLISRIRLHARINCPSHTQVSLHSL